MGIEAINQKRKENYYGTFPITVKSKKYVLCAKIQISAVQV